MSIGVVDGRSRTSNIDGGLDPLVTHELLRVHEAGRNVFAPEP